MNITRKILRRCGLLLLAGLLLALPMAAAADEPYLTKVDEFFKKLKTGEKDSAIDFIYSGNEWVAKSTDAIANVKSKFRALDDLVGKYQSHQLLGKRVVADRYVYLFFFVAFDRQPLSFCFEFYRPGETWLIQSFSFNDDIDDLVEKGVRDELFGRQADKP